MIVDHKIVFINGKEVEIQARWVNNRYVSEWSFDGKTFANLNKSYDRIGDAMLMARCGAFIGSIHMDKLKEHGE